MQSTRTRRYRIYLNACAIHRQLWQSVKRPVKSRVSPVARARDTLLASLWAANVLVIAACALCAVPTRVESAPTPPPATLVADVGSGRIIHALNPDSLWYPASLTKLMTLYLAFDALQSKRVTLDQKLAVSRHAAAQPPTKLGLRAGTTITVEQALAAAAITSSNDAAVVIAEALAGNEPAFVVQMNQAASALGMTRTRYRNASGLPGSQQYTSARDVARLALVLYQRFPQLSAVFARNYLVHDGNRHSGHNAPLSQVVGGNGLKTGFTCEAGYNIALSAERGTTHLVAIVLGALSRPARNRLAVRLIERGFSAPQTDTKGAVSDLPTRPGAAPKKRLGTGQCASSSSPVLGDHRKLTGWAIYLGNFVDKAKARTRLKSAVATLRRPAKGTKALLPRRAQQGVLPRGASSKRTWKVLIAGFNASGAGAACKALRASGTLCVAHSPNRLQMPGYSNQ
ncbi:MAG: D-alanyl-D-alanine carboxypeptidase [Gammaproteobacteria bacterium]|jgi:D-alanyl-D-alanine carboxypeptidase